MSKDSSDVYEPRLTLRVHVGMALSWFTITENLVRLLILLLFTENVSVTMGFSPAVPSCMNSSCQLSSHGPAHCYCDPSCTVYGDCCHDANVSEKSLPSSRFSCEVESEKYWMITSCSPSWIAEQVADGVANVQDIVSSCEDPSVRATYRFLPPVTDKETELVYRNEFCAHCNGLHPSDVIGWRIQLTCTNSTQLTSQTSLLFSQLTTLCEVEHHLPPKSSIPPRSCKNISGLVYSCPEGGPVNLMKNCTSGGINLLQSENFMYANEYCAACWNESANLIHCVDDLILPPVINESIRNISILFDIYGSRRTATSNSTTYHIVEEKCPSGSIYDVFKGSCRILLLAMANCTNSTAVTLEGGSYTLLNSDRVFWKSYNLSVPIESVDTNGRPLVCIPSVESTTCVPIFLERNEYVRQLEDNSRTLIWKSNNASYIIEGYDEGGRPLICTNSTQTRTPRKPFFTLPVGADILMYVGLAIDIVSGLLFLLTFFLFKELRTFFSKLMANFVLAILLGDVMYLAEGPLFTYSELCIAFSIVLHYAFLCRFSWMSAMGSELVRSFYNVKRMKKDTVNKWILLSVYMSVAWLSPLVVVIPTIIVNFTVENSVGYGVGSRCWLTQPVGMAVAFGVPVFFSIVYNTIAFVVVMVIVVQMRRDSKTKSEDNVGLRKQSPQKDVRFAIALFTLTGLSWLFAFLVMFSPALSWAWYLFIIFNTTQALAVLIAFIFTGKVLHLYSSLLCCLCRRRHTMSSARTTRKPQIAETKLM